MRIVPRLFLSGIILLLMCSLMAQGDLAQRIQEVVTEANSQNAIFAISIRDAEGKSIYDLQSKSRMIPASTYKLITTLTSIDILGADYVYETRIEYSGTINDNVLDGDVVIRGSGDPSLGATRYSGDEAYTDAMNEIVALLQKNGINKIDGNIIVDDGLFDEVWIHPSWAWDDLTNYYAAGASGFNFHENLYFLDFERAAVPDQLSNVDAVRPEVPGLSFDNMVYTGAKGSGDNAYIFGDPYANKRWITGSIPPGAGLFTIKGAIPNPSEFFIHNLIIVLKEHGIMVSSQKSNKALPKSSELLGTLCSDPLEDLVVFASHTSNNLFCEAFFKTLGAQRKGEGSFSSGQEVVSDYIGDLGLDITGVRLEDGCGLSSRNRISPDLMTSFLHKLSGKLGRSVMAEYIPQAGKDGTVKSFLNGYTAQKHTRVKSGSINNVLAYAGLMTAKSGAEYTLCVMANGHDSNRVLRGQMEKILEQMYQAL